MTSTPESDEPRWSDRPTYEAARDELVDIVGKLESGQATLEESLDLWERGEYLPTIAQEQLDGAQERLDAAQGASAPNPEDAN